MKRLVLLLLVAGCDSMPTAPKLDCKPIPVEKVTTNTPVKPHLSSTVCAVR